LQIAIHSADKTVEVYSKGLVNIKKRGNQKGIT